ncbi:unnamed protein product [Oncorhynchus mykiss]|uniref:Placenta-specific protein 9 n=1 Tax=Oncorhynchus mykiss TaxID=8022 RepID=A0A060WMZ0_ONCMY|nr:unnamed protein product [Oncorhynchus mykiss]
MENDAFSSVFHQDLSLSSNPELCGRDHSTLHDRLDVVEKHVEDTVQKLEDELAVLLDAIEAPEWSPLLETAGKPVVDILDGQGLGEGGNS